MRGEIGGPGPCGSGDRIHYHRIRMGGDLLTLKISEDISEFLKVSKS